MKQYCKRITPQHSSESNCMSRHIELYRYIGIDGLRKRILELWGTAA